LNICGVTNSYLRSLSDKSFYRKSWLPVSWIPQWTRSSSGCNWVRLYNK
jgi:hypothetical protein